MLGNSLDPFPSGPLHGGRARQTQALAKPQEKVGVSLPTVMTRCFPACLAEKPAVSELFFLPDSALPQDWQHFPKGRGS